MGTLSLVSVTKIVIFCCALKMPSLTVTKALYVDWDSKSAPFEAINSSSPELDIRISDPEIE